MNTARDQFGITTKKNTIRVYVMTNEMNHEEVIEYFNYKNYFGLDAENVKFFPQVTYQVLDLSHQQSLPAMDYYGKLIMEDKHKIFKAPNGSGGVFVSLLRHRILKEMYLSNTLVIIQERKRSYLCPHLRI